MKAAHKLARSGIKVISSMPTDEIVELAEKVVEETRGVTWDLDKKVRLTVIRRDESGIRVAVRNKKAAFMIFWIKVNPADGGGSRLVSEIDQCRTQQSMLGGFIPTGPKKIVGYGFYKQFMLNLEGVVRAKDSTARIEILEVPEK